MSNYVDLSQYWIDLKKEAAKKGLMAEFDICYLNEPNFIEEIPTDLYNEKFTIARGFFNEGQLNWKSSTPAGIRYSFIHALLLDQELVDLHTPYVIKYRAILYGYSNITSITIDNCLKSRYDVSIHGTTYNIRCSVLDSITLNRKIQKIANGSEFQFLGHYNLTCFSDIYNTI